MFDITKKSQHLQIHATSISPFSSSRIDHSPIRRPSPPPSCHAVYVQKADKKITKRGQKRHRWRVDHRESNSARVGGRRSEIVCRAGAWFVEPGIEKTSPIAARNNLGQLDVGISAYAFYSIHLAFSILA